MEKKEGENLPKLFHSIFSHYPVIDGLLMFYENSRVYVISRDCREWDHPPGYVIVLFLLCFQQIHSFGSWQRKRARRDALLHFGIETFASGVLSRTDKLTII